MLKLCSAVANVLDLCSTQITDVLWRNIPAKFAFKWLCGFRENEFFKYIYAKTLFFGFPIKFFFWRIYNEESSHTTIPGPSWLWSYGSWIYNYLCNQCLSPLMLWIWISIRTRCTTLCDKVCQWLTTGQWFSPGPPVSSTNKTDRHDITEK